MFIKKGLKYSICFILMLALQPTEAIAYSYSLNAITVYKQAQAGNYEYFRILNRYPRAIDIMDNSGNTAYCLALKNRDTQTSNFLAAQGADTQHSCVNKIMQYTRNTAPVNNTYQQGAKHFIDRGFFADDKNIYYTAAGVAIAGAAIAGLASIHKGGGSSSGGGDTPTPPSPSDLFPTTVSDFKTNEYTSTNTLPGIKAAEAYTHMYKKDAQGNIYSHQARSDNSLAKIKVGILDNGVYTNQNLAGDIAKTYNINIYNGQSSVWTYIESPTVGHYIVLKDGKYYASKITHIIETNDFDVALWGNGVYNNKAEIEAEVQRRLKIPFESLSLVNAPGAANPGEDLTDFNYAIKNTWRPAYAMSHGTHVAGIISANRNNIGMHGVAFENAQLYAASWDFNTTLIYSTIKDMIDNNVTVLNHSWGVTETVLTATDFVNYYNAGIITTNDDIVKSYLYGAKKGSVVWVQAAGNDSKDDSDFYTGMGRADFSKDGYSGPGEHENPFLSVVSLDLSTADTSAPAGKLADYSNHCGITKDYCIAAPGSSVLSTAAADSGEVIRDGTSMATPVVSGSIALLNGYYPWLSSQNIAYLILETANNKNEYANDNKYGRGALDLEAAVTTPIGNLGLATQSNINSLQPVNQNKLYLNGTTQKQLAKALPQKITVFDELQRPFDYDTSNLVSETHASNANFRNKVSHAALGGAKKTIKDDKTGFSFSQSEALDKGGKQNLSSAEIIHETDDGSATRLYYAENSKYMVSDNILTPSTNPFLTMNEAYGAENIMKLSDVSKLKLSLQTGENGMYERDYEQDRNSFTERSYAINAEYNFNLTDYLELSTLGGMLFEENAMLGMNGQGGFAIKDGSTYYMGLKAALNLTPNLTLLAAYYRGYTEGQEASLLALSDIETESYMIAGEYKLSPLHKVGLSLSSPLSVVKGKTSFRYASGRDSYSDTVYMQKLTSSLKPAAKEYDLGIYYQGTPQSNLNLLGKLETRFNADGEKGVTDYLGIMGMQYAFPK